MTRFNRTVRGQIVPFEHSSGVAPSLFQCGWPSRPCCRNHPPRIAPLPFLLFSTPHSTDASPINLPGADILIVDKESNIDGHWYISQRECSLGTMRVVDPPRSALSKEQRCVQAKRQGPAQAVTIPGISQGSEQISYAIWFVPTDHIKACQPRPCLPTPPPAYYLDCLIDQVVCVLAAYKLDSPSERLVPTVGLEESCSDWTAVLPG